MASKRQINVGGVLIGGGAPISVQSMTNTKTSDVEATLRQIEALRCAGCDIVRCAVPDTEAAHALGSIVERASVPIVADIHFDYKLALEAAAAGVHKIRINPGNIGASENVRAVAKVCREKNIPIRIGVNGGSLEKGLLAKYGGVTAAAMVESARKQAEMLESFDFGDIALSLKSSSTRLTIEANRLAYETMPYPLHLGVTEAGTEYNAVVKSAAGIGALLAEGIGDTIRVSITGDPVREPVAGVAILKALELRKGGIRFVSCPTCGRTSIDLIGAANEVERRLKDKDWDITVAVMGCVVNGPGEASGADYGLAGGKGKGVLFRKGQVVATVPEEELVESLISLIEENEKHG